MLVKRKVDICFTPALMNLFDLSNKKIVIIDVFRATSAICVFLNNGGDKVIPVASIDEALEYKNRAPKSFNNYIVAAERNGKIAPGFDLGNSPLLYENKKFKDKSLVITTTNGTMAIEKAKPKNKGMILASFLNVSSVVSYILNSDDSDVLIVCSGWKGRMCIEDTILAGLISKKLCFDHVFETDSDSILIAQNLYEKASVNLFQFLSHSSYMKRLNLVEDVKYCLKKDIMKTIPIWREDRNSLKSYFTSHI